MGGQRPDEAEPHGPAEQPGADVEQLDFVAGDEPEVAELRVALREQVEIGNVAVTEEAQA